MLLRLLLAVTALTCCLSAAHLAAQVPAGPGDWPQWRGPNRDGISLEQGLLKEWPKGGPPVLWQVDSVGAGYSSLSVKDGRIFTQGDLDGVEHVLALNAADGKVAWAVQPAPVAKLLETRLASEMKQLDRNSDGVVDEFEALSRFGWEFNKYDRPLGRDLATLARARASSLFARLDKDSDGRLLFAEAGSLLRDYFERADSEDKQANAAKLAASRAAALIQQQDKDGDVQIARKEAGGSSLDRAFGRIDQRDPATNKADEVLTREELEQYFAKSEPGRDGLLTIEELLDFYAKQKVAGDGQLTIEEMRGPFGGYRNGMGDGPRGTPTVDGDRVYAEGGNGDLTCLEAKTGRTIWHVNLRGDFGGGMPGWGYSESPLIVGELVIVTPGGKQGTVLALNKMSGEKVWQSGGIGEGAHYSSPVVATIAGTKQIVQFGAGSVFGVSLADGKFLWKYSAPANGTANCCTPIVDEDYVFASSSYGVGGGLVRISGGGESLVAEQIYFEKKMACHHGGIVKIGDYMYSNGGGALICMHFRTGETKWQNRSAGKGSLVAADGMLYVFGEQYEVALVEATPDEYREHGRFKTAPHGKPSWAHPVVAGGRLFLRDQESLTAYDVRGQ